MNVESAFAKSPCVGRCSTVYGDPICRGCKRFMNEVSFWNQLPLSQKKLIWLRLDQLAKIVLPEFIRIFDEEQLQLFMKNAQIKYPSHLSSFSWALHCLENYSGQLSHLSQTGLTLVHPHTVATTKDLKLQIQKAIYQLSLAQKHRHQQIPSVSL